MAEHIALGRECADVPHIHRRAEFQAGRWHMVANLPGAFFSLCDAVISGQLHCDATISTRPIDDIMAKPPAQLAIPPGFAVTIFCPIGRAADDAFWATLQILPGLDGVHAVRGGTFAPRSLSARLQDVFGSPHEPRDEFTKIWLAPHAKREVWVRRDFRASVLCPAAFPPREPAPAPDPTPGAPEPRDMRTPMQIEAAAHKVGIGGSAPQTEAVTATMTEAAAIKLAKELAAVRAKAVRAKAKKKSKPRTIALRKAAKR